MQQAFTALLALTALALPPSALGQRPAAGSPSGPTHVIHDARDMPESVRTRIDAVFAEFDRPGSPGAVVGVIRDGRLVYARGYGEANLEYGIALEPASVFHVASVSKHFTAFAIGLLAEEGRLSWDDDVRRYLPELHDFGHRMTLRHLASHTSGLRDQWELLAMSGWRLDDVITREHIMTTLLLQRTLNFEPGAEYLYSNSGYSLLAEIVERVTGQTFAEFAEARIFGPLGMTSTHVHDSHDRIVPNRAYSYARTADGFRHAPLNYANHGATSLFTTVEDMARWEANLRDPQVGSQALIARLEMRTPLNGGETSSYGLGFQIGERNGRRMIYHGGADAGYRTTFNRFPEAGWSFVVFSNLGSVSPGSFAGRVADIVFGDTATSAFPSAPGGRIPGTAERVDGGSERSFERGIGPATAEPMQVYAGTYYSPELGTSYTIVVRDGRLVATHRRHEDIVLNATLPDRFQGSVWYFRNVRFTRAQDGQVDGLRVSGGRVRNLEFRRLE